MKKKVLAVIMAAGLSLTMAACTTQQPAAPAEPTEAAPADPTEAPAEPTEAAEEPTPTEPATETPEEPDAVMTYAEYAAAEVDDPVVIEAYVQATQSWWDGKITVYAQDKDGAYFIYNMACISQEEADKLTEGTKIRVNGFKAEWSGEVEIVDATYEIIDGNYVASATDVTDKLGTDSISDYMNQFVAFKGMTLEGSGEAGDKAFLYNWDGSGTQGDDLYFTVSKDGKNYTFCVESYLCGADTDVYKAVEGLSVGDTLDLEGFMYWYEGPQPHITSVTVAK